MNKIESIQFAQSSNYNFGGKITDRISVADGYTFELNTKEQYVIAMGKDGSTYRIPTNLCIIKYQ